MMIKNTENKDKNDEVSGYVPVKLKRILMVGTSDFLPSSRDGEFPFKRRLELRNLEQDYDGSKFTFYFSCATD